MSVICYRIGRMKWPSSVIGTRLMDTSRETEVTCMVHQVRPVLQTIVYWLDDWSNEA